MNWNLMAPEDVCEWVNGEPHVPWATTVWAVIATGLGAFLGGLGVGLML